MSLNAPLNSFAGTSPSRPAGIWFATLYTAACALVGSPVFAGLAAGRLPLMYEDTPVTGPAVELFGLVLLLACAIPGAVLAYGLMRERPWARPGLLAWWIVMNAAVAALGGSLPPMTGMIGILGLVVYLPVFWWYLYHKRSVVEYYDSLERLA